MPEIKDKEKKREERIRELNGEIAFWERRSPGARDPDSCGRFGRLHHELAALYREKGEKSSAVSEAEAAIRYYGDLCKGKEDTDTLWSCACSWILLRNLLSRSTDASELQKALKAAEESARLFLRMTELSAEDDYFVNYQICVTEQYEIMLRISIGSADDAYDLCETCLQELKRWKDNGSGMQLCRIGELYYLMERACTEIVKKRQNFLFDWRERGRVAFLQAETYFEKAAKIAPKDAATAGFLSKIYENWRLRFADDPEKRRKYTKAEYQCYRVLFSDEPLTYARDFFMITWVYADRFKTLLTYDEKGALCEEMERNLNAVRFFSREKKEQPSLILRSCYYLASLFYVCFPWQKEPLCAYLKQCISCGAASIGEQNVYGDADYYIWTLELVKDSRKMSTEERVALLKDAEPILQIIGKKTNLGDKANRVWKELKG